MSKRTPIANRRHTTRRYHNALNSLERLEPRLLLSGIVTTYANIATTPHPTLPAKYAAYTDPDFGTKVIRLTDASDGNDNHNAYSYWPSFNKDNTRIMIWKSTRAELYSFNPTTMAISDLGALYAAPAPDGSNLDWQDAIWSANDPNTIYAHATTGSKIYAYNVNTRVYTLVHDFSSDAGWAAGDYINQLSKSMDDDVFAFTRKQNGTWAVLGWEAYKKSTNTALKFVSNVNIDEVQVDKSGQWVVEKYGDSSGDNVWNLSTGTATWLVDGNPDYSPDHSDMGSGMIVAAENWQNNTTQRSLSTPHSFTNIFVPPPANEGGALWQDGHISMLMAGDQWALKSLEYTGTKTGPFLREFFLVATDGSGRVIRFGHNYTVNVGNYWHNSFANISRDGRFAITTSDMGDPNRTDVYIIRVPIPGDTNLDYLVDGTDLAIYNANAGGSNKNWDQGDWNADRIVNSADLALWTANQTNPGSPTVTISANDAAATEAAGNTGQWTVTRTGATTAALVVNITKSGTAVSGTDYTAIGTTVTIPIGASSATINLTPTQDSLIEGTETAIITIASGSGYTIGSPSAGTVNITDDDLPTITIAATDSAAAEAALNTGTYTVTRTGTYPGTAPALTVNYTISGTATNGFDYNTLSGSVTIASGSTTATITLTPIDDAAVESTETAILTLSTNANYAIGSPSAATVNITDNDVAGVTVTIAATDSAASETLPNNGVFTVTRTGATTAALTVNFTKSGTATNTTDYSTIGTTVVIPIGASSTTVTVTPVDDALVEGTETVILTLASGAGYTVGSPSAGTVNITDNDSGGSGPAYDGFGYTVGGGANWNGGSGGSGWGGNWFVVTPADAAVVSGSLTYSNLLTSGNKVTLWHQDTASRNTAMSYGVDGTSRWVGFLMNVGFSGGTNPTLGGELDVGPQLWIGSVINGNYALRANIGGTEYYANSTTPIVANTTAFVVARMDYGATDTVRLWVNPTPGNTPSDASAIATLTLPGGVSFSTGNTLTLNDGTYYTLANFDELRYGAAYADVAPTSAVPPTAPTNLVADPGTTSIGLTWTDNSSTETGFKIWRSTDNATWGSPIFTTAANATSWSDTTVTQGTGYYYKVAATNAAGDSTSADMTSARATVLASDSFPGTVLNGSTGGVGWSGAWTVTNATDTGVTIPGLTYSNAGHALVTSGNSIWTWHQESASRNVSTSYGTDGTSRWVGFLMNVGFQGGTNPTIGGELDLGSQLWIGSVINGNFALRANIGAGEYYANSTVPIPQNTTSFVVARMDYGTTDTVRLWVNPTPGIVPSDASAIATLTLPAGVSFSVGTQIKVQGGTYYTKANFDEIRYGLSYVSVAPDPLVPTLNSQPARRSLFAAPSLPAWNLPTTPVRITPSPSAILSNPDTLQLLTDHLDWSAPAITPEYHTYAANDLPEDPADQAEPDDLLP